MTDNEKLVAFVTAISLMLEAQERLSDAEKLFHKCGIELCDAFSWGNPARQLPCFTNAKIYKGIKNFEKISGVPGYFANDYITGREDKSRRYVEYHGLKFVQLHVKKGGRAMTDIQIFKNEQLGEVRTIEKNTEQHDAEETEDKAE